MPVFGIASKKEVGVATVFGVTTTVVDVVEYDLHGEGQLRRRGARSLEAERRGPREVPTMSGHAPLAASSNCRPGFISTYLHMIKIPRYLQKDDLVAFSDCIWCIYR